VSEPLEVALADGALHITWPSHEARFAARALREACRCAECTARARRGEPVRAAAALRVVDVTAIGAYAAQLTFSDGHQRGVYPWSMLQALALRDAG
jgi:DUF971 family protein